MRCEYISVNKCTCKYTKINEARYAVQKIKRFTNQSDWYGKQALRTPLQHCPGVALPAEHLLQCTEVQLSAFILIISMPASQKIQHQNPTKQTPCIIEIKIIFQFQYVILFLFRRFAVRIQGNGASDLLATTMASEKCILYITLAKKNTNNSSIHYNYIHRNQAQLDV